jgi:transposase
VDAVKANEKDAYALDLVRRMDELFAVDREAREAKVSLETRAEWRRERSAAIVAGIKVRLESKPGDVLPQSRAGKGVRYGLGQWKRLVQFLEYPEIELSNNLAENSMRPAVLGRKNWIHVGSVEAGPKVAAILSVMESCRRMGVPVREYLGDVLPGLGDRKVSEVAELTPSAWARRRMA